MFWLISEGYEHNSGAIGSFSAHAHWLVYKRSHKCDLMVDMELPVILCSKESGPSYLATQGINFYSRTKQLHLTAQYVSWNKIL